MFIGYTGPKRTQRSQNEVKLAWQNEHNAYEWLLRAPSS